MEYRILKHDDKLQNTSLFTIFTLRNSALSADSDPSDVFHPHSEVMSAGQTSPNRIDIDPGRNAIGPG